MRRYELSPRAQRDLQEIWDYIARDNPAAADRTLDRFEEVFRVLGEWPQAGRRRIEISGDLTVLTWTVAPYLVVYLPENEPLRVVRVLHGARDLEEILGTLDLDAE